MRFLRYVREGKRVHNAYGARDMLLDYTGLPRRFLNLKSGIVWPHGWIPSSENFDPDMIVSESGDVSQQAEFTYLVARSDQEMALRKFGVASSHAVGLPFAYALQHFPASPQRRANSLIIMPSGHGIGVPDSDGYSRDRHYLQALLPFITGFEEVTVVMNCDDFSLDRNRIWEEAGFPVIIGGCESDPNSLERLVGILTSYEYMTTNSFGSALVYAAAAGCKVSIFGPRPVIGHSDLQDLELFRNRPDLVGKTLRLNDDDYLNESFTQLGLLCEPRNAVDNADWGKFEIGFNRVHSPSDMRALLISHRHRHSLGDRIVEAVLKRRNRLRTLLRIGFSGRGPWWEKAKRGMANLSSLFTPGHLRRVNLDKRFGPTYFRAGTSDVLNLSQHFWEGEMDGIDFGNPVRVIDLGAYGGYSILYFLLRFPQAEVLGVEADPENFALLEMNVSALPRVRVVNKAVWNEDGVVSILKGTEGLWSNKAVPLTRNAPTVEATTLTRLLEDVGWERADVIKMDVEGAEYEVLQSLGPKIADLCTVLAVEFHQVLARKEDYQKIMEGFTQAPNCRVSQVGEFTVVDFRPPDIVHL